MNPLGFGFQRTQRLEANTRQRLETPTVFQIKTTKKKNPIRFISNLVQGPQELWNLWLCSMLVEKPPRKQRLVITVEKPPHSSICKPVAFKIQKKAKDYFFFLIPSCRPSWTRMQGGGCCMLGSCAQSQRRKELHEPNWSSWAAHLRLCFAWSSPEPLHQKFTATNSSLTTAELKWGGWDGAWSWGGKHKPLQEDMAESLHPKFNDHQHQWHQRCQHTRYIQSGLAKLFKYPKFAFGLKCFC